MFHRCCALWNNTFEFTRRQTIFEISSRSTCSMLYISLSVGITEQKKKNWRSKCISTLYGNTFNLNPDGVPNTECDIEFDKNQRVYHRLLSHSCYVVDSYICHIVLIVFFWLVAFMICFSLMFYDQLLLFHISWADCTYPLLYFSKKWSLVFWYFCHPNKFSLSVLKTIETPNTMQSTMFQNCSKTKH